MKIDVVLQLILLICIVIYVIIGFSYFVLIAYESYNDYIRIKKKNKEIQYVKKIMESDYFKKKHEMLLPRQSEYTKNKVQKYIDANKKKL